MTTSGTNTWKLDVDTVIRRAYEKAGGSRSTTNEVNAGVDALNMVLRDIENRGVMLGTLALVTVGLVSSTPEYALNANVVDVLSGVVNVSASTEYAMERIPLLEYHRITNKTIKSRPTQFSTQRARDNVNIFFYPTPDKNTYKGIFWAITASEDVTALAQNVDISNRFTGALIFGTAYYLSFDRNRVPLEKREQLKMEYERQLTMAFAEDRQRSSFVVKRGRARY